MRKYLLLLILALCLMACGSDSKSGGSNSNYTNLEVGDSNSISAKRITGTIATNQEVDLYQVDLTKTGRNVQIKCTQKNTDEDISGDQQNLTLLMQIYEEVDGEMVMIAGEHAVEGSPLPADLKQSLYVDRTKSIFVHVRDLMDDNSSDRPYYISATYEEPSDGNDSLSGVDTVVLSIDGASQTDSIGSVGDTDYFRFTAPGGVYNASVDLTTFLSTGVELNISLIQSDGTVIENRNLANTGTANLIHNLAAGDYAVVVTDQGNDDFSPTSFFEVSISSVTGIEVNKNDSPATAATTAVNVSIDYYEDQDWYQISHVTTSDISVMNLSFSSINDMGFQLYLYAIDVTDVAAFTLGETNPAFENIYMRSLHGELNATVKLDPGLSYYVMVKAADGSDVNEGKTYSLTMDMSSVVDDDDVSMDGNNDIGNATPLAQTVVHTEKKIAFRGDIDYYSFTVPPAANQILSVYLDVPATSGVDYAMEIINNTGATVKTVKTLSASRRGIDLKTAIQVNSGELYRVKVYDLQSNNSDTDFYTIHWDVGVAIDPPGDIDGAAPSYHSEIVEAACPADSTVTVRYIVETGDNADSTFKVNATTMNMDDVTDSASGHTFPWVAGYIDYQDDEDWFSLDLRSAAGISPVPESYYYTISLELRSLASSPVEYTLEVLPDTSGNKFVNSHTGIQAALGDENPDSDAPIDRSLISVDSTERNNPETCIWVGSGDPNPWSGLVYFRIRDFYNIRTTPDNSPQSVSSNFDRDWSITTPYYFQVKIKLISGRSIPFTDVEEQ